MRLQGLALTFFSACLHTIFPRRYYRCCYTSGMTVTHSFTEDLQPPALHGAIGVDAGCRTLNQF